MASIHDLLERRAQTHERAQSILNRVEKGDGKITDEDARRLDGLLAEFDRLSDEIRAQAGDALAGNDAELRKSRGRVSSDAPGPITGERNGGPVSLFPKGGAITNLFGRNTSTDGWGSFGEFMLGVASKRDNRLRNAFEEGTAASGGFAVPPAYSQALFEASLEMSSFARLCRIVPMQSSTLDLPAWDDLTRSSTLGGLAPVWISEGATSSDQTGTLRKVQLVAKKLATYCQATSEMLADVPNFSAELARQMTRSVAWGLDYATIRGTGVGQPLGIMSHSSLITGSKDAGQTGGTLTSGNLLTMAGRLAPQCWRNAVWLISPSALGNVFTLSQSAGPFAGVRAVELTDSNAGVSILGRPVYVSEHCSVVGTTGDCILADPSSYLLGLRREISVETSTGPGWHEDQLAFRAILRADGQSSWDKVMTPRVDTTTLSWAVTIETRS